MDIEHANIPDSALHENKGAASAAADSFLTGKGDGTSEFRFITVSDLPLNTSKGNGRVGYKNGVLSTNTASYASISKTAIGVAEMVGANQGVILTGSTISPEETGVFLITIRNGLSINTLTTVVDTPGIGLVATSVSTPTYPTFRDVASNTPLFSGLSGMLQLTAGVQYDFTATNIEYSLVKVS